MLLKFWYSHQSVSCMLWQQNTENHCTEVHTLHHILKTATWYSTAVSTSCLNYRFFIDFSLQDHIHNQDTAANQCYISGREKKGITSLFLNTYLVTLRKIHTISNKNCYRKVTLAHPASILIPLIETTLGRGFIQYKNKLKKKKFTNSCVNKEVNR